MNSEDNEYFVPHAIYPYIGYYKESHKISFEEEMSKHGYFAEDTNKRLIEAFETFGWVYCVDCKQVIYDVDEALQHITDGHWLSNEFMQDNVAPEEVPAVD
ncbi:MAG: hypothetical protein QXY52_02320 [Conexivisphaerales archaeon]